MYQINYYRLKKTEAFLLREACLFFVCVCVRISVNSSNVQSLLDAANQYQIEPVKRMCVEFLKGQIDATNCLGDCTNTNTDLPFVLHMIFTYSCSVLL